MKVLLTGGGTGGHITPLLAVAQKLKASDPETRIMYVGDRAGDRKFAELINSSIVLDERYSIHAGKFRRYHGESWLHRIFAVKTNLLNLRDGFLVVIGTFQSLLLLHRVKPDVILLKGGFAGVPVGYAAAKLHIPFITHDSDAQPGLANRLVARWARYHAVALPPEEYNYPVAATRQIGVLVGEDYCRVTPTLQRGYRDELHLPHDAQVILVTGGSGGAAIINEAFAKLSPKLLESHPKLHIIHQTGPGKETVYGNYVHQRLIVRPLLNPLYRYSGAADVIVTRAGANTLAEFGIQGKACIVIPNPLLTGGHQLKNANILDKKHAIKVVHEAGLTEVENNSVLEQAIVQLLTNSSVRTELGQKLHEVTVPDAADRLAKLLLKVGEGE